MFERESDWTVGGPAIETVRGSVASHGLSEDIGSGDVTTMATVPHGHKSRGIIHAKQSGILAGIPLARLVFEVIDKSLTVERAG